MVVVAHCRAVSCTMASNGAQSSTGRLPQRMINDPYYSTPGHPWRLALEKFYEADGPRTRYVHYFKQPSNKIGKNATKKLFGKRAEFDCDKAEKRDTEDTDNKAPQEAGRTVGPPEKPGNFCIEEQQGGTRLTSPAWGQKGSFTASAVKLGLLEPIGHTKVSVSGYYRPPAGATLPPLLQKSKITRKRAVVPPERALPAAAQCAAPASTKKPRNARCHVAGKPHIKPDVLASVDQLHTNKAD